MIREIEDNLRKHVQTLAGDIGERSFACFNNLEKAANYIETEFNNLGYTVEKQTYQAADKPVSNLIAQKPGTANPDRIIIVGAHYDTVAGSPGADDNASGVAGLLELARLWGGEQGESTVRFVGFTLEEPPFYKTELMGSRVYARSVKEENIVAMLCLEMLGYYTIESQDYPLPLMGMIYPDKGNFIAMVGNLSSRTQVKKMEKVFKQNCSTPAASLSTFDFVTGVDFSDHASFWEIGVPAVMVTDTAFYRNPHYHGVSDLPHTLDYPTFAQTVWGLYHALLALDSSHKKT